MSRRQSWENSRRIQLKGDLRSRLIHRAGDPREDRSHHDRRSTDKMSKDQTSTSSNQPSDDDRKSYEKYRRERDKFISTPSADIRSIDVAMSSSKDPKRLKGDSHASDSGGHFQRGDTDRRTKDHQRSHQHEDLVLSRGHREDNPRPRERSDPKSSSSNRLIKDSDTKSDHHYSYFKGSHRNARHPIDRDEDRRGTRGHSPKYRIRVNIKEKKVDDDDIMAKQRKERHDNLPDVKREEPNSSKFVDFGNTSSNTVNRNTKQQDPISSNSHASTSRLQIQQKSESSEPTYSTSRLETSSKSEKPESRDGTSSRSLSIEPIGMPLKDDQKNNFKVENLQTDKNNLNSENLDNEQLDFENFSPGNELDQQDDLELSSLSSSSISLSSREGSPTRIVAPLDGWRPGNQRRSPNSTRHYSHHPSSYTMPQTADRPPSNLSNWSGSRSRTHSPPRTLVRGWTRSRSRSRTPLRRSNTPMMLPRSTSRTSLRSDRGSRSRSGSRGRQRYNRSNSPLHTLPPSTGNTWESRVSDFVRTIGICPRAPIEEPRGLSPSTSSNFQVPPPIHPPGAMTQPFAHVALPPSQMQFAPMTAASVVHSIFYPPPTIPLVAAPQTYYNDPRSVVPPTTIMSLHTLPKPPKSILNKPREDYPIPETSKPIQAQPKLDKPNPTHVFVDVVQAEEDPSPEDVVLTPLVKFIGDRLSDKCVVQSLPPNTGFFRSSLLSTATRSEWIAAKVLEAFEKSGFPESQFYDISALKGSQAFKEYLKSLVDSGKISFGTELSRPEKKMVKCVIGQIVKYYSFDQTESSDSDEQVETDQDETGTGIVLRGQGLAEVVQRLAQADQETSVEMDIKCEPVVAMPEQPPINPWSMMWNNMQSDSFKSFLDLKNFLAKGFLGSVGNNKHSKNSFSVAQDMISCWVMAGFSLNSLRQLVMTAVEGKILPPPNYTPDMGKYLFHDLLEQVRAHSNTVQTSLSEEDLEYLVRKTLIYVARGCDRMSALATYPALAKMSESKKKAPASNINYVYNYLPPGLREQENTVTRPAQETKADEDDDPSKYISSDPLNRIIDPVAGSHRPGELPNRKYMIGAVHLDWVIVQGRPEIFELSIYTTDMTSLDLFIVTDALQKHQDTLEHLNFVSNPDRHEFYYVQIGIGCVRADRKQKGFEKLSNFLDEKRNSSTSENQNNGLVLLFRGEEELSVLLSAWQSTGHNDLLLDTVKGFGVLSNYMDQNKSSKLDYTAPKFSVGGNEGFYTAEVKRGIEVYSFISKSKGQSLYQAFEIFLQQPPSYQNFIHPYCFPSFGPQVTSLKTRQKQVEEMYPVEVYMAAALKRDPAIHQSLFLEGVYAPSRHRDLRDKCSIVAARFCTALVQAGFDKSTLTKCFKRDPGFSINSSVILDKMSVAQKMSVTDQTIRCIHILKDYFKSAKED